MKGIRLIPILLMAATALLLLKAFGLITHGGYVLTGTGAAVAQAPPRSPVTPDPGMVASAENGGVKLTSLDEEAARRAADSLFSEVNGDLPDNGQPDALPVIENSEGKQVPFTTEDGTSLTKEAVLQRLSDRRAELDARAQQLDEQASLVAAAEMKLEERIAGLETLKAEVQALLDLQVKEGDQQFDSLVSMYSNMKPADAAKVFDTLDMNVLLRLAIKITPRKMSPILAAMTIERAQELTLRMASGLRAPATGETQQISAGQSASELPQIVGQ